MNVSDSIGYIRNKLTIIEEEAEDKQHFRLFGKQQALEALLYQQIELASGETSHDAELGRFVRDLFQAVEEL